MKYILLILGFLIIITCFINYNQNIANKTINNWALSHNYKINKIDSKFFDYGPFYYCNKGSSIYRIQLTTKDNIEKVFYCRTNIISDYEYEQYK